MSKHPAEVFGYSVENKSQQAREIRERFWCPFVDEICYKQSRLIDYPMGVCTAQYNDEIIAICPRRFLQGGLVFRQIAEHYFGSINDLLVFREVRLRDVGTFDYVIVKHKPLSDKVEDFVAIEFQTGQTTGTGKLVQALEDFMHGTEVVGERYGFGMNMYDIWKRTFTQILNKGMVLEQWGQKIYWVIQEPVYRYFTNRYNLGDVGYSPAHTTVFMVYDMAQNENQHKMVHTRVESSTVDGLFAAFRNNPDTLSKDEFIQSLQGKIERNVHIDLKLG